ncbi:hypothetical protein NE237_032755 [Protea cynaroides]|uniref:Uncharacterized protein n=1 Tax=Protea cynaroides TaxID=273540 RepID=A0A9Q0L3L7_9MAGN|nr:hypothetical protein NE237_032755 [Protea cynaroides]
MQVSWEWTAQHTRWLVGDGRNINLWTDRWLGPSTIAEQMGLSLASMKDLETKVSDFILNGTWCFSVVSNLVLRDILNRVAVIPLIEGMEDKAIWRLTINGNYSVSSAWKEGRLSHAKPTW